MKFFESLVFLLYRLNSFFQFIDREIEVVPVVIAVGDIPLAIRQFKDHTKEGSDSS